MEKARELEREMAEVKQAKIDSVVRQFETQIRKEAQL